jgi:hypothetical protein
MVLRVGVKWPYRQGIGSVDMHVIHVLLME